MRIFVSPHNVVNYPQGGGHFWVYMQYVQGLRAIGCDVWWIEEFKPSGDRQADSLRIEAFLQRLSRYDLDEKVVLYTRQREFFNVPFARALALVRSADLLLNFHQRIEPWLLDCFARTALVDIDPGLLQYWIASGQLAVPPHDLYFTTGETVGTPRARFPDCGLRWIPIRPPVSLDFWPCVPAPKEAPFTTVSTWWGGEWVIDSGEVYDNNKRSAFLRFADLPQRTRVPLELALLFDPQSDSDREDRALLAAKGWSVRDAHEVARTPQAYQRYIRASRGEFSAAKPSCVRFENAWISDRTLCYLATGRPAVVEDTGTSSILPSGRGLFRFSTLEEAAAALEAIESNYWSHAKAARELAELFDARRVAETIVRHASPSAAAVRGIA